MRKFLILEVHEDEGSSRIYNEGLAKHAFEEVPRIGEMVIIKDRYYKALQIAYYVSGKELSQVYRGSIYVKAYGTQDDQRHPYLPPITLKYFKKKFEDLGQWHW